MTHFDILYTFYLWNNYTGQINMIKYVVGGMDQIILVRPDVNKQTEFRPYSIFNAEIRF